MHPGRGTTYAVRGYKHGGKPGIHPRARKSAGGTYEIDQGDVYGFPVTYNPDNDRFYLHSGGVQDGTGVLGTWAANDRGWANLIQFVRTKRKTLGQPGGGT
jgi:hypothetical protein